MQEWKIAYVNRREVPVLISDEKEALLAAKAAGRAIVGLWRQGQPMDEISAAAYVVEDMEDVTDVYLERIARRHLGLPWRICETERLVIRELFADDFDEVWMNRIGLGFGSVEELQSYTEHQYSFYEFGFWALVEKTSGDLVGVAGLKVPEDEDLEEMPDDHAGNETPKRGVCVENIDMLWLKSSDNTAITSAKTEETVDNDEVTLELGYHIFRQFRKRGYAEEACRGILKYGTEELGVSRFMVRIDKENKVSRHLAERLGFLAEN